MTNKYEELGHLAMPATPEDKAKAKEQGTLICDYQRGRNAAENPVHASRNYKETGWKFEAKSQLAEILVARHLGLEDQYIGFQTEKEKYQQPDLAGLVEVRRTTRIDNPLTVYTKDVRAGALVVRTFYEDNTIYITGWEWAQKVWDRGSYVGPDARSRYLVKPAETLYNAVHGALRGEAA